MKTAKFSPNSLTYRRGMMSSMPKVSGYCERSAPHFGSYNGVALKHNVSVDSSKNDYRCRDKRLRYYEFPELLNMNS